MAGFREYLGALDDYIGDDDMLGAAPRRRAPARAPLVAAAQRQLHQAMPGVPKSGPRLEPLGFPVFAFALATATTVVQTTNPQKPFKGSRLVLDIARSGATAIGLVTVGSLKVGARDVLVNTNPIGAATFAANAFGVELMMDEAVPGVNLACSITLGLPALAAADIVNVSATVIGMTWT